MSTLLQGGREADGEAASAGRREDGEKDGVKRQQRAGHKGGKRAQPGYALAVYKGGSGDDSRPPTQWPKQGRGEAGGVLSPVASGGGRTEGLVRRLVAARTRSVHDAGLRGGVGGRGSMDGECPAWRRDAGWTGVLRRDREERATEDATDVASCVAPSLQAGWSKHTP
jgi:hypothetical protein